MTRRADLFITCSVDGVAAEVGEATVKVLRHFGVEVDFPASQTCCGQPAFNSGYRAAARVAALHFLEVFESSEAVVSPSGSCVAMVRHYYPDLFPEDAELRARFEALGKRVWELSQYLTQVLGVQNIPGRLDRSLAWHHCCHSLRGLGIREEPLGLLDSIDGLERRELPDAEVCCGFGGLFSIKFDEISAAMLKDKVSSAKESGAEWLGASDCSCLFHIGGGLRRESAPVRALHLAEILAAAIDSERGEKGA